MRIADDRRPNQQTIDNRQGEAGIEKAEESFSSRTGRSDRQLLAAARQAGRD
jgi:hypothetical protein